MEKEKEEPNQKEFPFMDETPPTRLFPFIVENENNENCIFSLKLKRKGEENDN
jgi:hypothetical protein